ncbi:multicopper oxidase domain-containing protein [Nonomuraea sp. NPDC052634]|uniref:multicopper oxidase domain-containing protein n=1 Tax=Nonomuraea sp. NPDC052634 TaxID=3155813 RepID=UPI00343F6B95
MAGVLGDVILVNGAPWPVHEADAARYRLPCSTPRTRAITGSKPSPMTSAGSASSRSARTRACSHRPRDVEVWRLVADVHHSVHLHLVGFRVLSGGGRPPLPHDAGLKDMVSLRPGEAGEIITRFAGYRGRYLLHRHNAEHEDVNGRFRGLSDHLR